MEDTIIKIVYGIVAIPFCFVIHAFIVLTKDEIARYKVRRQRR